MASKKIYSSPELYEDKLVRVMARLGIEEGDYNYDWSRQECWVEFRYKGEYYRFSHSVKNAQEHGISCSTAPMPLHRSCSLWKTSPVWSNEASTTCLHGWPA